MDINITKAFNAIKNNAMDYSASRAELGDDAGPRTWAHACEDVGPFALLQSRDELLAFAKFVIASGGWTAEDIGKWTIRETRALFLQWIAGDMREANLDCDAPDWSAYEVGCSEGRHAANIFRADDGQIYFTLE